MSPAPKPSAGDWVHVTSLGAGGTIVLAAAVGAVLGSSDCVALAASEGDALAIADMVGVATVGDDEPVDGSRAAPAQPVTRNARIERPRRGRICSTPAPEMTGAQSPRILEPSHLDGLGLAHWDAGAPMTFCTDGGQHGEHEKRFRVCGGNSFIGRLRASVYSGFESR